MRASVDEPRGDAAASAGDGRPAAPAPGGPPRVDPKRLDELLRSALAEDVGPGDVTTEPCLAADARARGTLLAKGTGRLAAVFAFRRTFELLDPEVRVLEARAEDGARVAPGERLRVLEGRSRALLAGERTALNLVQPLSGIATRTAAYVERAGGRAAILDTRKTTPGLRFLEKYAVSCGGGVNHRTGLYDEALIKNNHVDLTGESPGTLVGRIRARHPDLTVTAEARDDGEALDALRGGADVVLLDNFEPDELERLVGTLRAEARRLGRAVRLEASGGITLDSVARFAATGVDRISVGALTHSAPALDLAFRLERVAP